MRCVGTGAPLTQSKNLKDEGENSGTQGIKTFNLKGKRGRKKGSKVEGGRGEGQCGNIGLGGTQWDSGDSKLGKRKKTRGRPSAREKDRTLSTQTRKK